MTRPIVTIIDITTQEQIVREMNDEEYAQHLSDIEQMNALQAEEAASKAAKADAKKQALAALGLSQEVVNLLAE